MEILLHLKKIPTDFGFGFSMWLRLKFIILFSLRRICLCVSDGSMFVDLLVEVFIFMFVS